MFIILLILINYSFGFIFSRYHKGKLKRISRGNLILTFDDGPGDKLERRIIELLIKYKARATFFLLWGKVEQNQQQYNKLLHSNQEIGLHAYTHLNAWKVFILKYYNDIISGYNGIIQNTQPRVLFRPPYGKITFLSWLMFKKLNLQYCYWTHASGDTYSQLPEISKIVDSIIKDDGGVVLMHSFDRDEMKDKVFREQYIIELSEKLLKTAKQHNWRICTLGELFRV